MICRVFCYSVLYSRVNLCLFILKYDMMTRIG